MVMHYAAKSGKCCVSCPCCVLCNVCCVCRVPVCAMRWVPHAVCLALCGMCCVLYVAYYAFHNAQHTAHPTNTLHGTQHTAQPTPRSQHHTVYFTQHGARNIFL